MKVGSSFHQNVCTYPALSNPACWLHKEAADVMGDSEGRWFPFQATMQTVVCLEKHQLPDHLKQLPNLETPMYLQALLMDLEDSGEAPCHSVLFPSLNPMCNPTPNGSNITVL